MNALRLLLVAVLAAGLVAGLQAEAKDKTTEKDNAAKLIGQWEVVKAGKGGPQAGSTLEFSKGNLLKVVRKGEDGKEETSEGTYTVEGDKLLLTRKGQEGKLELTIKKLTPTELILEREDRTTEFKRKK
jgi:uncharacterized protein (TIGR03066 family)